MTDNATAHCSFCNRSQDAVRKLIRGGGTKAEVYICDECVDLCNAIIFGEVQSAFFTLRMALRGLWWRITRRFPSGQDRPRASN